MVHFVLSKSTTIARFSRSVSTFFSEKKHHTHDTAGLQWLITWLAMTQSWSRPVIGGLRRVKSLPSCHSWLWPLTELCPFENGMTGKSWIWRLCVVRCHVQGFVLAVYGQCNIILEIFYHGWWFYIIPGLLNIRIWKLSYSFLKQHSHICRLFCMKGRGCSYWMSSCKFTFSPPYISLFWKKCRRFMQGGLNKLYNAIYLLSMVWWSWWF